MKKLQYNSPVVLTFFFLSMAELILSAMTGGWIKTAVFAVYRAPLSDPLTWVRFFGHVLGHADLDHFPYRVTAEMIMEAARKLDKPQ